MTQYNRVQESSPVDRVVNQSSSDHIQMINHLLCRIERLEGEIRRQSSRIRGLESSLQEISYKSLR